MSGTRDSHRSCLERAEAFRGVKRAKEALGFLVSSRFLFFFLLLFSTPLAGARESRAAFEGIVVDSKTVAMGDCWSASDHGIHPLAPVPSARTNLSVSGCYCAPYGLPELEQKNVLFNLPSHGNVFTLGVVERGGSLYKERILSASVSRQTFSSTRFVFSLGMFSMSIGGHGEARFLGFGTGLRSKPVRCIEASVGMGNLASSSALRLNREAILPTFLFGLTLTPGENVIAAGEMRKTPGKETSLHLGVEFRPQGGFRVRCGVQTVPIELAMGFAVELGSLAIETASSFHPVLGRTDVITLTLRREREAGRANAGGSAGDVRRGVNQGQRNQTKEAAE